MRWILCVLVAVGICLSVAPTYAQGDDAVDCKTQPERCFAIPPKDAARLSAKSDDLAAVKKQVTALEAVIAAQARQLDAQAKVIALQDEEIKRRERITALADEERDVHKGRADRIEAGACSEVRKARAFGYGAAVGGGMLVTGLGAPFAPLGVLAGVALGYLLPCP